MKTVYFDALTSNPDIAWTLSGPRGNVFNNRSFNTNSSSSVQFTYDLTPGDYELLVQGIGDGSGEFAFQVLDLGAATAISGNTIVGELTQPHETQAFSFAGQAGQVLLVDSVTPVGTARYQIIDPTGMSLGQFSGTADTEISLTGTGQYLFIVEARQTAVTIGNFEYGLIVELVRDAGELELGAAVSDSLVVGEKVAYQFELTEKQLLHIDSRTNRSDIRYRISGPAGNIRDLALNQTDNTSTGGSNEPLPAIELSPGSYTLTFDGVGDSTGDFEFALINLSDPAQSTTIDLLLATPVTISESQTVSNGTIAYRFDAAAGDLVSFEGVGPSSSVRYKIIDAGGKQLGSAAGRADLDFEAPATGNLLYSFRKQRQ